MRWDLDCCKTGVWPLNDLLVQRFSRARTRFANTSPPDPSRLILYRWTFGQLPAAHDLRTSADLARPPIAALVAEAVGQFKADLTEHLAKTHERGLVTPVRYSQIKQVYRTESSIQALKILF